MSRKTDGGNAKKVDTNPKLNARFNRLKRVKSTTRLYITIWFTKYNNVFTFPKISDQ